MFLIIYAVSFTLGLIRCVEAVAAHPTAETVLLVTALVLIGLRLIYSPAALRQYVELCATANKPVASITLVYWHFPLLLSQAGALYAACFTLKESGVNSPVSWFAVLTIALNAIWLLSKMGAARCRGIQLSNLRRPPFWFWNNLVFVAVVSAILLFLPQQTVLLSTAALLCNSLIDLWFTADWYRPLTGLDERLGR